MEYLYKYLALNDIFFRNHRLIDPILKDDRNPVEIFDAPWTFFEDPKIINKIKRLDLRTFEKQYNELKNRGFEVVTLQDSDYPWRLKEISSPPLVLYYKGNLSRINSMKEDLSISIVGTRSPGSEAKSVTNDFVKELVSHGFIIVSGCAIGIDGEAHASALRAGGFTVGVKSCGVEINYPVQNSEIIEEMGKKGVVVSEFPPYFQPIRSSFSLRNRIISGLTKGTLVVEAGIRSGSLVTASHAVEQNRELFAVPCSILMKEKQGTNFLIQKGAKCVFSIDHILEEYNIKTKKSLPLSPFTCKDENCEGLSLEESEILNILDKNNPRYIDLIISNSGLTQSRIYTLLLKLELDNRIKEIKGKGYIRL